MKLLSEADVHGLMDPDAAIRSARDAYTALSTGGAEVPLRIEIHRPDVGGVILVMPGLVHGRVFGLKLIANREEEVRGLLTTSMVLLFDAESLAPLGLISSDYLTDLRTAAGLAAATDVLARPDATTLALYGAGKLAEPCVRLIARIRRLERVILVGRSPTRVAKLAERLAAEPLEGQPRIETGLDPDAAAGAADIVSAVTSSPTPVFDGRRLRAGTHVNLGGAFRPTEREADDEVAGRALFYVDSLKDCLERAGDVRLPLESGVLVRGRLRGEIGALFAGRIPGRGDSAEITVFKSLGTAVQDLMLGDELLRHPSAASLPSFNYLGTAVGA